jgi:2-polyprenyl-3-methyl-5-hydroxy-6-metoxy-1,4-benzoquinol methylase
MLSLLTNHREMTPEIMDRADVEPSAHRDALEGLRRINVASKAAEQIARPIIEFAGRGNRKQISILDVACGGGDVPIGVAMLAKASGLDVELILVDRSPTALRTASEAAERAGISHRCVEADLTSNWPALEADVVTCSLFLHHLEQPGDVIGFLIKARQIARRQIVISDLRRCRIGYLIAWFGGRILSRSRIVHHDGPVSVRAAWTMGEMRRFAAEAGLENFYVRSSFPWRMLLVWESGAKPA